MRKFWSALFKGVVLFNVLSVLPVRSQFVTDGQTNVLDSVTNSINGGSSVGSTGSYTLLIVTNGAAVTNISGSLNIGANASAQSNRVIITDSNSFWKAAGFNIGQSGSASELDILHGATANTGPSFVGQNASSSNNLVLVSGVGSKWSSSDVTVGGNGFANTMIVTNGGTVFCVNSAIVGGGIATFSNRAQISGFGSELDCGGPTYVGYVNSRLNSLIVNQGAAINILGAFQIGYMANSNKILISDEGSILQCQSFRIGNQSVGNECVISNGAQIIVSPATLTSLEGTLTKIKITGSSSTLSNLGTLYFGQTSNLLEITDGGRLIDNYGYFEKSGSVPSVTGYDTAVVAGANSLWQNTGNFYVGTLNQQLFVTNSGILADNFGYVGHNTADGTNYVLISDSGSCWVNTNDLTVGAGVGMCRLFVADSGMVKANNLMVAGVANKTEVVVTNSGVVVLRNNVYIGNLSSKSNKVTISGGTMIVSNEVRLVSYGTINLNSGIIRANSFSADTVGGSGTSSILNFRGGILQSGSTDCRFQNPFTIGDGTNMAEFEMINGGNHLFSNVVLSRNASLKGLGTITAANVTVNNGGTLAPGTATLGTITINGTLIFGGGSTNTMKLDADSDDADLLIGMASVTYGGTLQLNVVAGNLKAGDSFHLFSATNYLGAFDKLLPPTPGPGLGWDTARLKVDGVLGVIPKPFSVPAIQSKVSNGRLLVSAGGGFPYDTCYLWACTNFPPQPSDWTCIATNNFDFSGATVFTNPVVTGEAQHFFRVQIN